MQLLNLITHTLKPVNLHLHQIAYRFSVDVKQKQDILCYIYSLTEVTNIYWQYEFHTFLNKIQPFPA